LKGELETLHKVLDKVFQTTYMDNWLKEFEECFLDNALLKVQEQTLADNNSKWKEWWQTIQEIMEEQIQDGLEIIHTYEENYLNELVAYQLQFECYKCDRLTCKLVEVHVFFFFLIHMCKQQL
jgi:hypothetical protein